MHEIAGETYPSVVAETVDPEADCYVVSEIYEAPRKSLNVTMVSAEPGLQRSTFGFPHWLRLGTGKNATDFPFARWDDNVLSSLLSLAVPKEKVDELCKLLLDEFGCAALVVSAPVEKLNPLLTGYESVIPILKSVEYIAVGLGHQQARRRKTFPETSCLMRYLRSTIASGHVRQSCILCFNKAKELVADEAHAYGSVTDSPMYIRDIVKVVLQRDATSIIFAENDPTGKCIPCARQRRKADELISALSVYDVAVEDYIIISPYEHFSFRERRLI